MTLKTFAVVTALALIVFLFRKRDLPATLERQISAIVEKAFDNA